MPPADNYALQAKCAKARFLTYDQEKLILKFALPHDERYLYPTMLGQLHRLSRTTGDLERQTPQGWVDANSFREVMTLLDMLCDSREDRHLSGRWKNMLSFGRMFHQNLLEEKDPWAEKFQAEPEKFRKACLALGGVAIPQGDIAYAIELFEGLRIGVQLWFGDEEFPPNLRYLWDENALMYLKYETMYFARALLLRRLREEMEK